MNKEEFKKLIKESVKEVLTQELHQLIGTIVKSSIEPIIENIVRLNSQTVAPIVEKAPQFKGKPNVSSLVNKNQIMQELRGNVANVNTPQVPQLKKNPTFADILSAPPVVDPDGPVSSGRVGFEDEQLMEKMQAINSLMLQREKK